MCKRQKNISKKYKGNLHHYFTIVFEYPICLKTVYTIFTKHKIYTNVKNSLICLGLHVLIKLKSLKKVAKQNY